jgi:hypothetical protein
MDISDWRRLYRVVKGFGQTAKLDLPIKLSPKVKIQMPHEIIMPKCQNFSFIIWTLGLT